MGAIRDTERSRHVAKPSESSRSRAESSRRQHHPHTCNSVEPGIYLPEFGMRTEVDVYVDEKEARVTGAIQTEILPLLA